MDADTGRILYAKNGFEELAMASTTKIMTCILALESSGPDEEVTVSGYAASQPKVKLGMREGQVFRMEDLLYSLMLESHNDSAVAIAEHVGGSVQGFADRMNEKAKEIACMYTYYITPNGLDARDEKGIHHTTAADLASVMRYCVMQSDQKEKFLEITGAENHTFSDIKGESVYSCTNHNAFLHMMEGALSGKTGFTADAGYCYVGAVRKDGKTLIAALLACGWPNNKGYKWADMRLLMEYGLGCYEYRNVEAEQKEIEVQAEHAALADGSFPGDGFCLIPLFCEETELRVLMKEGEEVWTVYDVPKKLEAPVKYGEKVGEGKVGIGDTTLGVFDVYAGCELIERTFSVCFDYVKAVFFMKC